MDELVKISDQVFIGRMPPDESDLERLASKGFASVVNVRPEEETDQPLSPREEGEAAARYGLHYAHVPIERGKVDASAVERFKAAVADLPAPVFVHCGVSGGTAEAVASAVLKGDS